MSVYRTQLISTSRRRSLNLCAVSVSAELPSYDTKPPVFHGQSSDIMLPFYFIH